MEHIVALKMKVDKAVCTTNDTLDDLQKAIRYETVFSTLVEKKILAIKRECEAQDEKKRAQREQACFAGRFFRKRRLGSRDQSTESSAKESVAIDAEGRSGEDDENTRNSDCGKTTANAIEALKLNAEDDSKMCSVQYNGNKNVENGGGAATATVILMHNPNVEEHVDEKNGIQITNEDIKCQQATCDDEETSAQVLRIKDDAIEQCYKNGSTFKLTTEVGDENDLKQPMTIENKITKGECNRSELQPVKDTLTVGGLNVSTRGLRSNKTSDSVRASNESPAASTSSRLEVRDVVDDLNRRKPSSDTTISYPSSCKQTTFSAPEAFRITPADHERHRLRVLEAKSVSAQCSPIFPRHPVVDSVATQVSYRNEITVGSGVIAGARSKAKKLFSRQNTSDDSVNVTFSNVVVNETAGIETIPVSHPKKASIAVGKRGSKKDKTHVESLGFISNFNQLTAHNNLPVIATSLRAVNSAKLQRYLTTASDGTDCFQRQKSVDDRFQADANAKDKEKTVKIGAVQNSDDDESKKNKKKTSEY